MFYWQWTNTISKMSPQQSKKDAKYWCRLRSYTVCCFRSKLTSYNCLTAFKSTAWIASFWISSIRSQTCFSYQGTQCSGPLRLETCCIYRSFLLLFIFCHLFANRWRCRCWHLWKWLVSPQADLVGIRLAAYPGCSRPRAPATNPASSLNLRFVAWFNAFSPSILAGSSHWLGVNDKSKLIASNSSPWNLTFRSCFRRDPWTSPSERAFDWLLLSLSQQCCLSNSRRSYSSILILATSRDFRTITDRPWECSSWEILDFHRHLHPYRFPFYWALTSA